MSFDIFKDISDILTDIAKKCISFKIGKTSNVEKRFQAPDYQDKYSHIEV